MKLDDRTKERIAESQAEKGFSVAGFSRREFVMMLLVCQEVLTDDDLLESVNPLSKFKGHESELTVLSNKINEFLDV